MVTRRLASVLGLSLTLLCMALAALKVSAAPPSPATTTTTELHVCPSGCAFASVQAAVDVAQTGDVIKVAEGVYTDLHNVPSLSTSDFTATQIVAITKTLTLAGGYATTDWTATDPDENPTILDAAGQGRVMVITGTISPTITGFRMIRGDSTGLGGLPWSDVGGAVYVDSASPLVADNLITGSHASAYGGGIYLSRSSAALTGNTVAGNQSGERGGGIYLTFSPATIGDNTIIHNTTTQEGGGLCSFTSEADLTGNHFEANTADYAGGGLFVSGWGGAISRNVFIGNEALQGGGFHLRHESGPVPVLANNVFQGNQAPEGSGLWLGGAHYPPRATIQALHTTFHSNISGPAVLVDEAGSLALTNTILAGQTAGISVTTGSTVTTNGTLWYDNGSDWAGNVVRTNDVLGDPVFAADGFHLSEGSAAIDAGVSSGIDIDVDGDRRPQGAGYDLGADELPGGGAIFLPLVIRGG